MKKKKRERARGGPRQGRIAGHVGEKRKEQERALVLLEGIEKKITLPQISVRYLIKQLTSLLDSSSIGKLPKSYQQHIKSILFPISGITKPAFLKS